MLYCCCLVIFNVRFWKSYYFPKCSFDSDPLEQLTSLNYFSEDQLKFIGFEIIKQLKDIAIDVSKRKCKNTMRQMFCIECALVKKNITWLV